MATETHAAAPRSRPPWVDPVIAQAIALGVALLFAAVVGSIIILLYDESPRIAFLTIWNFSTARPQDFAIVLENATPLIFSGLAVAVAFKAGLFNIGVEGQYIVGMAAAAAVATGWDGLPAVLLLPLVVLASVMAAMAWAAVPGVLKVKTGAHEVVTTIMMNGIAISLVAWLLLHPLRSTERGLFDLRTDIFPRTALMPSVSGTLGIDLPETVHLTWFFVVALLACLGVWLLLFRSRLGYEIRAVGSAAGSAEAGGISIGAAQIKVFLISGALAGFVGLNHILGDKGYLGSTYEAGLGFAGIAVAFLGRNHPAGIPLAAVLLGMLLRGQDGIAITTELPTEILIILQGVLILSVVIAYEVVNRALARRRQRQVRAEETEGAGT
jgi:ABC-type uncharacterized transport system permease subunit